MAVAAKRLPINAPGAFFVDESCIDCGTCWTLAPEVFEEHAGETARVARQPADAASRRRAFMALVSCPTASIGIEERGTSPEVRRASRALPDPIAEGVWFCGYASPNSYGAASYLLQPAGAGPVLVDSPRAAGPLLERLRVLGGVERMFLTHRDDVADHRVFRTRFACERILHEADVTRDTADVERLISGEDPVALGPDLLAVPLPGHTRGSMALLWQETFLFSGDHVWGEDDGLGASRGVCWWSWPAQIRSMERLLDLRFEWVLPGHGARFRASSAPAMRREVERLLARMRRGG